MYSLNVATTSSPNGLIRAILLARALSNLPSPAERPPADYFYRDRTESFSIRGFSTSVLRSCQEHQIIFYLLPNAIQDARKPKTQVQHVPKATCKTGKVIEQTKDKYAEYKKGGKVGDIDVRGKAYKILDYALRFQNLIGDGVKFDPTGHGSHALTLYFCAMAEI
ncbi:hypothetical protein G7Y89_g5433 [Cudoniella acicularis]|uniref:Uncharacterized protein n=1 Tax=Cudoniella acicularis TaxID=354080 RepID=A0A8H4W401_9HELO|nr:hypothetical protein G7Y89_g5433 [Cudoniella acicularis]